MFPNVRLMIAAVFASVVVLSFGFGIFAAFRVNHEPLSRLPSGVAPPQFIADVAPSTAVPAVVEETPGSGLQSNAAALGHAVTGSMSIKVDRRDVSEIPVAIPATELQPDASTALNPPPTPEPKRIPIAAGSAGAPAQQSPTPNAEKLSQQALGHAGAPAPAQQLPTPHAGNSSQRSAAGLAGESAQSSWPPNSNMPAQRLPAASAAHPAVTAEHHDNTGGTVETTGALSRTTTPDTVLIDQSADHREVIIQDKARQAAVPKSVPTVRRRIVRRIIVRRRFAATSPGANPAGASTLYRYNNSNFSFAQPNFQYSPQVAPRLAPRQVLLKRRVIKRPPVRKVVAKKTAVAGRPVGLPAQ